MGGLAQLYGPFPKQSGGRYPEFPHSLKLKSKASTGCSWNPRPSLRQSSKISAWKMKPDLQKDCNFRFYCWKNVSELTQRWYSIQRGLGWWCTNCSVVFTAGLLNHPFLTLLTGEKFLASRSLHELLGIN